MRHSRVVMISPSWVLRIGLSHIIGEEQEFELAESFSDLSSVSARKLDNLRADVVILDPSASSASGMGCLREYYEALKGRTLVGCLNAAYSQEIIDQFDSFFTINDTPAAIVRKIREAATDSRQEESRPEEGGILSAREKEVLAEVSKGLTNKEIADKLSISVFTVTTHRKNISQKLGIHSIAGLTVYAVMNRIISVDQLG